MSKMNEEESIESKELAEWPYKPLVDMLLTDLGVGGAGMARLIQQYLAQRTVDAGNLVLSSESTAFDRGRYQGLAEATGFIGDLLSDYVHLKYQGVDARKLDKEALQAEQDAVLAAVKQFELTFALK